MSRAKRRPESNTCELCKERCVLVHDFFGLKICLGCVKREAKKIAAAGGISGGG